MIRASWRGVTSDRRGAGEHALHISALAVLLVLTALAVPTAVPEGAASAAGGVTATVAEQPGARPDFIFPLTSQR